MQQGLVEGAPPDSLAGARLSPAAAALGLPLHAFTTDVGVDVVSVGGTKNGALAAEAIVVLNESASVGLHYLRKMNMQLASKMRFVSAQLVALYEGDLFLLGPDDLLDDDSGDDGSGPGN